MSASGSRPFSVICSLLVILALACTGLAHAAADAPWKSLYTGAEAAGEQVIALWQFLPGKETQDNSGHGHNLTLRGETRFAEGGLFGNCLDVPPAGANFDTPQGAVVDSHPALTPPGPFTLELWIRPRAQLYARPCAFLLDKKYMHYAHETARQDHDYCLLLQKTGDRQVVISAALGYGSDSVFCHSEPVELVPGCWYHVAFTYDGRGDIRFFLDGRAVGRATFPGRGPISAGTRPLVIGDRIASSHWRFPGSIDQVRISRGIPEFLGGPGKPLRLGDGSFPSLTPVSGNWYVEKGKLLELSDAADEEGRPFFTTFEGEATDNILVTADFEAYDAMGNILVSPAWTDRDNYVAAVWADSNVVRLVQVLGGEEKVLAEKKLDGVQLPVRLGAAISGRGLRAYVNGDLVLKAGALFQPSRLRALGGWHRRIGFRHVKEETVSPWSTPRSAFCPLKIERPVGRTVFYRMERDATMALAVRNLSKERLSSVKVRMVVEGFPGWAAEQVLKDLAPEATVEFTFPVPTDRLRPDWYTLLVHAEPRGWTSGESSFRFTIVPRPNPNRFPVLNWGGVPDETIPRLAQLGFTAVFGTGVDFKYLWDNPEATTSHDFEKNPNRRQGILATLETIMGAGMEAAANFSPGGWLISNRPELHRVQRYGSPARNLCPFQPPVREFCRRAAQALMSTYGPHPVFSMVNIHSELRDGAEPCFCPVCVEAYRKATGLEIPPEVTRKDMVHYTTLPDFPADHIVPDDHPVLTYLRWYWKEGDGWVPLNDAIHDVIKGYRKDVTTWHDPAVRVAPVYGSGGRLDMIGNWSYTNLDPIRVGLTTDELLCMAQGRQKVFQMVQAIWYRNQTAPKERWAQVKRKRAFEPWDDRDPNAEAGRYGAANFITPSPAHMTEAFWTAISRPIHMIGYHAAGALLPQHEWRTYDYTMTHRDTAEALGRVHREVLQPFGPMLLQIGNRPADVAFLESFANQVFTQQHTFGWSGGHIGAFWLASQYAGLQSDIVYDETIVEHGLDAYRVLLMPICRVLPRSVYEKIVSWQRRGGIVVADGFIIPAIKPDVKITHPSFPSEGQGGPWKEATLAIAAEMREALKGKYTPFARSENPEVVLHTRERDGVQYLFAVNDRRQFGDYVGRYGMVMEDGLPAETTITVRRAGVKVVDLVAGKEVPVDSSGMITRFHTDLEPGGGKIFVIAERLPAALRVSAPEEMERGKTAVFDIAVVDASGTPVKAVVPFEIRIEDPAFRAAEPSGFYAAVRGKARVTFDVAENERSGLWRVTVTERIMGNTTTTYIPVR